MAENESVDRFWGSVTDKTSGKVASKAQSDGFWASVSKVYYNTTHLPIKAAKDKLDTKIIDEFALFQENVWDTLSPRHQMIVVNVARDIQEIRKSREGVSDAVLDNRLETIQKRLETALHDAASHISSLDSLSQFGQDGLADIMGKVDGGFSVPTSEGKVALLVPSEEDLQIVNILKMMGIDLVFINNAWTRNRDAKASDFPYAPKTKSKTPDGQQETFVVFEDAHIDKLIDHLNNPAGRGGTRIVPEKLLDVYMQVYESKMGAKDRDRSSEERAFIGRRVAEVGAIFNAKSNEYQITRLLDSDTMIRNAQRVAIVRAYESMVSSAPESIISGIRDGAAITKLTSYKTAGRHLGRLADLLQDKVHALEDSKAFDKNYGLDYDVEYDRRIALLSRSENAEDKKLADELAVAKECYLATVEMQKVYWQAKLESLSAEKIGGKDFDEALAQIFSESVGIAIVQNGGNIEMANGDAVRKFFEQQRKSEVFEELQARLKGKSATQQQLVEFLAEKGIIPKQEEKKSKTSESGEAVLEHEDAEGPKTMASSSGGKRNFPDITRGLSSEIVGYNQAVEDYANLQFYKFLWETALDEVLTAFVKKNPDKSVSDFIDGLKKKEVIVNGQTGFDGVFDFEVLEEAYYALHEDEKRPDGIDNRIKAREEAFNKHILLADIVLSQMSEQERAVYHTLSEADKQKFIQREYKKAQAKYDELKQNPAEYEKWLARAKKRQEHGLVGATINKLWGDRENVDWGNAKWLEDTIDAYLEAEANAQRANNAELAKDGQPVIVCDDPQSEQKAVSSGKKKKTTFGDVYPSGPNTNKFLKKMKPYHAKEITKHFIEPLLEALDGVEINMDAYYAKIDTASKRIASRTGAKPAKQEEKKLTPEQLKALEDRAQQAHQQEMKIMQRNYEASAFIPAALMFESIESNVAKRYDDKIKGEHYAATAGHLKRLFQLISSTDAPKDDKEFGIVDPTTKTDIRDALRNIVLGVFAGNFKNTQDLTNQLDVELTKYQVPAGLQSSIRFAFKFVTPELLASALEPVATVLDDGKVRIEPKPMDEILKAKDDAERVKAVQIGNDFNKHMATLIDLEQLITVRYRQRGENADDMHIDAVGVDNAFRVGKKESTFEHVGKSNFAKSRLDAIRADLARKQGIQLDDKLIALMKSNEASKKLHVIINRRLSGEKIPQLEGLSDEQLKKMVQDLEQGIITPEIEDLYKRFVGKEYIHPDHETEAPVANNDDGMETP